MPINWVNENGVVSTSDQDNLVTGALNPALPIQFSLHLVFGLILVCMI